MNIPDIKILGPGLWTKIHMDALNADDDKKKFVFIENINYLCENFFCYHCRSHFRDYLNNFPILNYWHIENGFFRWSCDFHNNVNQRLGKEIVPYSIALSYYQNLKTETCTNCGTQHSVLKFKIVSK